MSGDGCPADGCSLEMRTARIDIRIAWARASPSHTRQLIGNLATAPLRDVDAPRGVKGVGACRVSSCVAFPVLFNAYKKRYAIPELGIAHDFIEA